MIDASVVFLGAVVELLGGLVGCGKLWWGPARDAVKAGSTRAKMEAEGREIRETLGGPRWEEGIMGSLVVSGKRR